MLRPMPDATIAAMMSRYSRVAASASAGVVMFSPR
jgi:hypothetical protein